MANLKSSLANAVEGSGFSHQDPSNDIARFLPVIDELVAIMGGDPAAPLRRAFILVNIAQHPAVTATDLIQSLGTEKSALLRDLDWLEDTKCLVRQTDPQDGRKSFLFVEKRTQARLEKLRNFFPAGWNGLQNFLQSLMNLFSQQKPTLRDVKIIMTVGVLGEVTRSEVFDMLYDGPVSTDNRAITNLINAGMIEKDDARQGTE